MQEADAFCENVVFRSLPKSQQGSSAITAPPRHARRLRPFLRERGALAQESRQIIELLKRRSWHEARDGARRCRYALRDLCIVAARAQAVDAAVAAAVAVASGRWGRCRQLAEEQLACAAKRACPAHIRRLHWAVETVWTRRLPLCASATRVAAGASTVGPPASAHTSNVHPVAASPLPVWLTIARRPPADALA
eukprot:4522575-Pleurochrysis_carterae.AAC.1